MTTLPLSEARANLSQLVEEATRTHTRFEVTRNGRRAAVLLSADDYDSLIETLDILSDQVLMKDLHEAETQSENGETFTLDEVTREMRTAGRLPR